MSMECLPWLQKNIHKLFTAYNDMDLLVTLDKQVNKIILGI